MRKKGKTGRAAEHEDAWDEGLDAADREEETDEDETDEESESEEDRPRKKSTKRKVADVENVMARAFYKALRKLRDGKASKGDDPPRKPEEGFFASVASWFGVDE